MDDHYARPTLTEAGTSPRSRLIQETARFWSSLADFDRFLTVSFSQEIHDAHGFRNPANLMKFVKRRLRSAGYDGAYVIVLHDNDGTRYFHPHILLVDGGTGSYEKVKRAFFAYGDVSHVGNGPIESFGAFTYCATRLIETEDRDPLNSADCFDMRVERSLPPRRRRRRRRRGTGRGRRPAGDHG